MKIGIFGGSFDPVHIGHLLAARDALEQLELDRILFVPARQSPFKLTQGHAPDDHRLAMLRAAIQPLDWAAVSAIELRRDGASYTIDTVRELQARHSEHSYCLLIGMDNLASLHKWREAEDLVALLPIHTLARPGWQPDQRPGFDEATCNQLMDDILASRELAISSSEIRTRISAGKSINYLVPESVRRYIDRYLLYQS